MSHVPTGSHDAHDDAMVTMSTICCRFLRAHRVIVTVVMSRGRAAG